MKTLATLLRQNWHLTIVLISIVCTPYLAYSIEPVTTLGQISPEKHAFLTDQTLLRTSYFGANIQIIHRDTREIIAEFGNRAKYSDVVFSPNAKHIAIFDDSTVPNTTTVSIWHTIAQDKITEWELEPQFYDGAAFSPTNPFLAVSHKNEIYLWNWQNGELLGKMTGNRRQREECYVQIFNDENGTATFKSCTSSTEEHEMVFTPDGKFMIVASKRPDIELWDIETRQLVGHFEGHTGNWVDGLAMSPDGTRLASYEEGSNYVYMWDVSTRQLLWKEPIDERGISDMIFSADNQHLYAAHHNVYIWAVQSGEQVGSYGSDYPGLREMILSPDGKTMLIQYDGSYLRGGVVELWRTETQQRLKEFADFNGGIVRLSPDGQTMATIETSFIKVWDVESQQIRFVIPAEQFGLYFFEKSLAISSDSKRIAYGKYPGIEIKDLRTGKVQAQYDQLISYLADAVFSPAGRWLTAVDAFGYFFIFDVSEPGKINRIDIFYPHGVRFVNVAFSENDEYMAATALSGDHNNAQYWILLWKRVGDKLGYQYRWKVPKVASSWYTALTFASTEEGSNVLALADRHNTQIWKIQPQNAELVSTLPGAGGPLQFSPDGRYLFTSRYSELQIWDWQTSRPIKFFSIPDFSAVSADGSILVSTDELGRYLIWDAANIFSTLPYAVEPKDKKIVMLGQIKHNQLLQNFPNPFNPETWIPYRIADESDVKVKIWTPSGELVRLLSAGRMAAGDYTKRSKAIHWDGRNDKGERVSSGVYLYTIEAGDFSATRKMLIRK